MGTVPRTVLVLPLAGRECLEILEDNVGSLEPLAVVVREKRDLVLPFPILLPRRYLLRDEVDAQLRQPLADGGGVWAPLGLVERQHEPMLVGTAEG